MAVAARRRIDLDGIWRFVADPDGPYDSDRLPDGVPIPVPSCWEALIGPTESLTTGWFVRSFDVPPDWPPGHAVLRFGAVSYQADVWLNGVHLGGHEGAYTAFELPTGTSLQARSNELVVRAFNPAGAITSYPSFEPHADRAEDGLIPLSEIPIGKQTWYSSLSGIWRHVELELRPFGGFRSVSVRPEVVDGCAVVSWQREPARPANDKPELRLSILDADGASIGSASIVDPAQSGETAVLLPGPRMWDLDDPFLYRLRAELLAAGVPVDAVEVRFGVREVGTAEGHVTLNGRPRYVRGVLDQDVFDETIWLAPSRAAIEAELRRVKAMGFNLVRCHIKVPDPTYLDIADELGLLVWAELPSWIRFTASSASRGRQMLLEMVEQIRHHPSVAIWTIINESWGAELDDADQRAWLRSTYAWLKELDPSPLVVDNSACWTPDGGNWHVISDIADYHIYFGSPDHADRWRGAMDEFAGRPAWLWSPHRDASQTGDEPHILSEFGTWGLPRPSRVLGATAGDASEPPAPASRPRAPWWTKTGSGPGRPEGVLERFANQGLDRIVENADALAVATQWHQFDALQQQVGELRRHPTIAGYVVTELADALWEANGLVSIDRADKVFGERLMNVFGSGTLFAELDRHDHWGGSVIRGELRARFDGVTIDDRLRVGWRLSDPVFEACAGTTDLTPAGASSMASGELAIPVPRVDRTARARLELDLTGPSGAPVRQTYGVVLVPEAARSTSQPRRINVAAAQAGTPLATRIASLGHHLTDDAELVVVPRIDDPVVDLAEDGRNVLSVIDASDTGFPWVTQPAGVDHLVASPRLARPVSVHARYGSRDPAIGQALNLDGDWISAYAWADRAVFPGLPDGALLDFAHRDIIPTLVLLGADDRAFATEVAAGSFVGWIAHPAAYVWSFAQGRGRITVTTLRLTSDGPIASLVLESLIQHAARA
jgi:hypothetical protein